VKRQVGSNVGRWRHRSWVIAIAVISAAALALSGCSSATAPQAPQVISEKGTPFEDLLVPKLQVSVVDGAIDVSVESPVTVSAGDGVLGAVTLVNERGAAVDGLLRRDGLTWSSAEPLGYNKKYTLTAEAQGLSGTARSSVTFQTHSPENLTMPYVLPNDGEVVGVGQPIAIRFDENIGGRIAVQRAIKITTSPAGAVATPTVHPAESIRARAPSVSTARD
jgi:hypothetical protein